ncbi:MAG: 4Fe-4S dicluster domain-containing protein [Turicibacter sp.]
MNIKKVSLLYFSPNGTTLKTLRNIAQGLGVRNIHEIDLTGFNERWINRQFDEDELVLIGLPVYSGRLVCTAKEILNHMNGQNTLCVPVVVYGNRDYEDALIELVEGLTKKGFNPIAAGTFIGEHSFSNQIATNRPDALDANNQIKFGEKIKEMVEELEDVTSVQTNLNVPGNKTYQHANDLPICPSVNGDCKECGACIKICPMKAIDPNKPSRTDNFRCILCMKCVKTCPSQARHIEIAKFHEGIEVLKFVSHVRREPEWFFSN